MKTQFMKFILAAGFALALAFTVSCSSNDDGEQPSSSSGTEISSPSGGGSSSSNGTGGSSSSNGGGGSSSSNGTEDSSSSNGGGGSSSSNGTGGSSSSNGGGGSSSSNGTEDSSSSNGGCGSSSSNGTGGSSSSNGGGDGGKLTYEGKTYKTVLIGTQRWMAENLNYAVEGSKCYENSEANCDKYGRLYDWSTARTVCPSGWHLPTIDEWDALAAYIQSDNSCSNCDAKHLKATSGWNSYSGIVNLDTYGFSALPGGDGSDGGFDSAGDDGSWWSASEISSNDAYNRLMYYDGEYAYWYGYDKSYLFSVRCVQD